MPTEIRVITQELRAQLDALYGRRLKALYLYGSYARGTARESSDIDILVTKCPRDLVYSVEAELEDIMNGLPFDVVYLELLPEDQREKWLEHAR